jgi:type I restriction enzyme S subunit
MSSKEWTKCKFREIAELRKEQVPANGKEQPYIGLEHIEQQTLRLNGIGSSVGLASSKFKFYKNDILYGKLRPYFRKVYYANFDGVCSTEIFVIKNRKNIDRHFLYYLIATEEFTRIANSGSIGTHMPRADWNQLIETEWQIPKDEIVQNRIGNILFSLDEKIENNIQTNITLEEIARTLFKEWFVNFNYPNADGGRKHSELGEIPSSWKVGGIGEVCYVQNGYAFKSNDFKEEGTVGIIKIKNINGNVVDIEKTDFVEVDVVQRLDKKFKVESGSLLIAMTGAEVGKIGLVPLTDKNLWLNQRVGMFKEKIAFGNLFMYLLLSSDTYYTTIQNSALGSAQPNISASAIESIRAIIPTADLIEQFGKIVNPMFEKILDNLAENETLKITRDSLLPKLMSGEIDVNISNV